MGVSALYTNRVLPFFDQATKYTQQHPTAVKMAIITAAILDGSLLVMTCLKLATVSYLAVTNAAVITVAALAVAILFQRLPLPFRKALYQLEDHPLVCQAMTLERLWKKLKLVPLLETVDIPPDAARRFSEITSATQVSDLHANYVGQGLTDYKLIATQAPKATRFNSFWETAFDHNAMIIDLTEPEEIYDYRPRTYRPRPSLSYKYYSDSYYPYHTTTMTWGGNMSVGWVDKDPDIISVQTAKDGTVCNIRHFDSYQVAKDDKQKTITRYHYPKWSDNTTLNPADFQKLVEHVECLIHNQKPETIMVHCTAGVGRTGTLITALILKENIEKGIINKDNLNYCLMKIVGTLRMQRNSLMVTTQEQFALLHQYAQSLLVPMK